MKLLTTKKVYRLPKAFTTDLFDMFGFVCRIKFTNHGEGGASINEDR